VPCSSKYFRNRSLTSVDFIPAPDDLRNLRRRKTASGQRVEHPPPRSGGARFAARGPEPLETLPQGLVFPLRAPSAWIAAAIVSREKPRAFSSRSTRDRP
jgi:hypothetical protein